MRLYEEQESELLRDLYATNREIVLDTGEAVFDRILTRNFGNDRVAGKRWRMEMDPQGAADLSQQQRRKVWTDGVRENATLRWMVFWR